MSGLRVFILFVTRGKATRDTSPEKARRPNAYMIRRSTVDAKAETSNYDTVTYVLRAYLYSPEYDPRSR